MFGKFKLIILSVLICFMQTGCAWWTTAFRTLNVNDGSGAMVDIKQRAIIVTHSESDVSGNKKPNVRTVVCAEPSPDAMAGYAAEVAAKANIFAKANAELSQALQESTSYTGLRTQSIQLLRDGFYRLCEGYMSGALDSVGYNILMRRYQRYMVALLAIEQLTGAIRVPPSVINTAGIAETAASLSQRRKEADRVVGELNEKKKEKQELQNRMTSLPDSDSEKVKLREHINDIDRQIEDRETDRRMTDRGIQNAQDAIVSGSATAGVILTPNSNERSDAHIQAVATVVGGIVTNILDTDDAGPLCWAYITTDEAQKMDQEVRKACLNYLNGNSTIRSQDTHSRMKLRENLTDFARSVDQQLRADHLNIKDAYERLLKEVLSQSK